MRSMQIADLRAYESQSLTVQSESLIKKLFKKPIVLDDSDDDEELDDAEIKFQKMAATSIKSIDVFMFGFKQQAEVKEDKIVPFQARVNQSSLGQTHKKSNIQSSEVPEQASIYKQAILRRFSFQALIEDMLNGERSKNLRLYSMIYEPFSYFFVWQGYLQQLVKNHPTLYSTNTSAILARMIYDAENYQFSKWCANDKQAIIRRIFKMKSQRYYCQRLINNSLEASESTAFKDQIRQFYHNKIKGQELQDQFIDQSNRYILKYIQQKEEIFSDIYK